jgi:hypothetical protein
VSGALRTHETPVKRPRHQREVEQHRGKKKRFFFWTEDRKIFFGKKKAVLRQYL